MHKKLSNMGLVLVSTLVLDPKRIELERVCRHGSLTLAATPQTVLPLSGWGDIIEMAVKRRGEERTLARGGCYN